MEKEQRNERASGIVYLVGAGPGDPGLMTARSLELIASADTVFYDRLIPPGALDGARPDAELVYVGKRPEQPADGPICQAIGHISAHRPRSSVPQEEINERWSRRPGAARAWCGSRAATRSSSGAEARRGKRCAPPGSSSRSCPG